MEPTEDASVCVHCDTTSYNAHENAGICISCPSHTKANEEKDMCILYTGYDINGTLIFLNRLNMQYSGNDTELSFIGPYKYNHSIIFISAVHPQKLCYVNYEYNEDINVAQEKANIFMLEHTISAGRHEKIKRILGAGVANVNHTFISNGSFTVTYNAGDICTNNHSEHFTSEVAYICNSNLLSSKIVNVTSKNGCRYHIYVQSVSACKVCSKQDIKGVLIGSCNEEKMRLYEYQPNNDCIIYQPLPDTEMEITSAKNTVYSLFEGMNESYSKSHILQPTALMKCSEYAIGFVVFTALIGLLFICVTALLLTLLCARKYQLLLFKRIGEASKTKYGSQRRVSNV